MTTSPTAATMVAVLSLTIPPFPLAASGKPLEARRMSARWQSAPTGKTHDREGSRLDWRSAPRFLRSAASAIAGEVLGEQFPFLVVAAAADAQSTALEVCRVLLNSRLHLQFLHGFHQPGHFFLAMVRDDLHRLCVRVRQLAHSLPVVGHQRWQVLKKQPSHNHAQKASTYPAGAAAKRIGFRDLCEQIHLRGPLMQGKPVSISYKLPLFKNPGAAGEITTPGESTGGGGGSSPGL